MRSFLLYEWATCLVQFVILTSSFASRRNGEQDLKTKTFSKQFIEIQLVKEKEIAIVRLRNGLGLDEIRQPCDDSEIEIEFANGTRFLLRLKLDYQLSNRTVVERHVGAKLSQLKITTSYRDPRICFYSKYVDQKSTDISTSVSISNGNAVILSQPSRSRHFRFFQKL
jgi:hypothetical protein